MEREDCSEKDKQTLSFSNVFVSDTVHLPIVHGFIAGSPPTPINIMPDTGSLVNFIVNKKGKQTKVEL